ncbi:hypothetical protein VNO77_05025 [Canavalia gladiata]|uniref:Uncharacterized protein n=1 Tax=Canavalia gladiata TaxID=3824 RepID=A0AAN9R595_CANGL
MITIPNFVQIGQFLFQTYLFVAAASSPAAWPSPRRLDVEIPRIYVSTLCYSGPKLELLEPTAWQAPPSPFSIGESCRGHSICRSATYYRCSIMSLHKAKDLGKLVVNQRLHDAISMSFDWQTPRYAIHHNPFPCIVLDDWFQARLKDGFELTQCLNKDEVLRLVIQSRQFEGEPCLMTSSTINYVAHTFSLKCRGNQDLVIKGSAGDIDSIRLKTVSVVIWNERRRLKPFNC